MIEYTGIERRAVELHGYLVCSFRLVLCPSCLLSENYFHLGECLTINSEDTVHVVSWRCDNGHVFSCEAFLERFDIHPLVIWRSRDHFDNEHTYRASGECLCDCCHRDYFSHPRAQEAWNLSFTGEPFLHRLCSGWLVKL